MITITWQLGDESGIQTAKNDREATKFNEQLLAKKLSLVNIKPNEVNRFMNKVYKYGSMSFRKLRAHREEHEQIKAKLAILQNTPLRVTFQRS